MRPRPHPVQTLTQQKECELSRIPRFQQGFQAGGVSSRISLSTLSSPSPWASVSPFGCLNLVAVQAETVKSHDCLQLPIGVICECLVDIHSLASSMEEFGSKGQRTLWFCITSAGFRLSEPQNQIKDSRCRKVLEKKRTSLPYGWSLFPSLSVSARKKCRTNLCANWSHFHT